MYNVLFGVNKVAPICLYAVDVEIENVERFRDAIFIKSDDHYEVDILTRTGGSNREHYPNRHLIENKNYIRDYDDPYDMTYAHFIFRVPKELAEEIVWDNIFRDQEKSDLDLERMFTLEIEEMEKEGTEANKRAKRMAKGMEVLMSQDSKGPVIITPEEIYRAGGDTEDGRKE